MENNQHSFQILTHLMPNNQLNKKTNQSVKHAENFFFFSYLPYYNHDQELFPVQEIQVYHIEYMLFRDQFFLQNLNE